MTLWTSFLETLPATRPIGVLAYPSYPYSSVFTNALKSSPTGTDMIPYTPVVPGASTPLNNTGASNLTYQASVFGGLFNVTSTIPGQTVENVGKSFAMALVVLGLGYVVIKQVI